METRYPHSRNSNSIADGTAFELYVIELLARAGIDLRKCETFGEQLTYGDAHDSDDTGYEIKLDQRCDDTGRLSIEVAEKTKDLSRPWVDSGIFSSSNATYYIQGSYKHFWVFKRADLQQWYRAHGPRVVDDNPSTIKKFYLPIRTFPADLAPVATAGRQSTDTLRSIVGQKPRKEPDWAERKRRAQAFVRDGLRRGGRWSDLTYDYRDEPEE